MDLILTTYYFIFLVFKLFQNRKIKNFKNDNEEKST